MSEPTKGKKKKKKKKKSKSFFKIFLLTILTIVILCTVAVSGVVLAIIKTAPPLDINQILNLNETSVIYDDKENPIDDVITTDENGNVIKRTVVSIKDTPPYLAEAFVSIEDERFYKHKGIDVKRILGALYVDVKNKVTNQNTSVQGASTITQQLIKNRLFLLDSQKNRVSPKRKIQEIYLALKLEKSLTKEQIIEAYMNTIFLGGNTHGVQAASKHYFSKNAKDLTLLESAFLAGINQSPNNYYPFYGPAKKNPSKYINRTQTVLNKMYELGYIKTKAEYDKAVNDLKNGQLKFTSSASNSDKYNYEWFSRPVIEQIKDDLRTQYHYTDTEIINLFMNGGLKIYTTMNKELQDNAQKTLNDDPILKGVSKTGKNGLIEPQAAATIMNYHTGEVKAIIGGRGTQPAVSRNRATSSAFRRAVGSSIKPITVYGAAIDSKLATASTVIDDSPVSDELAKRYGGNGKPYYPNNDDFQFMGSLTLREALKHSRNVVAVKLEDQIGLKTGVAYAKKFGIPIDDKTDANSMAAMALGQIHGTNTLTMTAAYGVFGNYGMYSQPRLYLKVKDKNGKVILENKYTTKKVISPESAYLMYNLLKGPVSPGGTGPNAQFGSMPVAGKTGTATDSKDLWFCGLTPYYSAAIWIGNDDWSKFYGLGSNNAAALWGKLMAEANKGLEVKDIAPPGGVNTVKICIDSGKLAIDGVCDNDPRGNRVTTEIFTDGNAPTALCDQHIKIKVNKSNGKLATNLTPASLIETRIILKKDMPQPDDTKPEEKNNDSNKNENENSSEQTNSNSPNDTNDSGNKPADKPNNNGNKNNTNR